MVNNTGLAFFCIAFCSLGFYLGYMHGHTNGWLEARKLFEYPRKKPE